MRDFRTLNISEIIIEKISHGFTLIDTDKMSFNRIDMLKLIQLIIECQAVSETASLNSDTIRTKPYTLP